jgi:hypothetical protein
VALRRPAVIVPATSYWNWVVLTVPGTTVMGPFTAFTPSTST